MSSTKRKSASMVMDAVMQSFWFICYQEQHAFWQGFHTSLRSVYGKKAALCTYHPSFGCIEPASNGATVPCPQMTRPCPCKFVARHELAACGLCVAKGRLLPVARVACTCSPCFRVACVSSKYRKRWCFRKASGLSLPRSIPRTAGLRNMSPA